jgi:hypothetical protein
LLRSTRGRRGWRRWGWSRRGPTHRCREYPLDIHHDPVAQNHALPQIKHHAATAGRQLAARLAQALQHLVARQSE